MSDSWVEVPRLPPHRCHRSSRDDPAGGPYYEHGWCYSEAGVHDDRELTLYQSAITIRGILEAPGSPFAAITREELAALVDDRDAALSEVDLLATELAEARAELQELRASVSAEAIADRVAAFLDARYARKPGPKTKAPA